MRARSDARWIVCEKSGRWALALRREVASRRRIDEVRSLAECWEALAAAPASFVVVELHAGNLGAVLDGLLGFERRHPQARLAIVAAPSLAACQWLFCEAGAVWFATSPRRVGPIASLARRHLDRASAPSRSVLAQIWESLPWGQ